MDEVKANGNRKVIGPLASYLTCSPLEDAGCKPCLIAQVVDVNGKKVLVAEADGQVSSLAVLRVSHTSHLGRQLHSAQFEVKPSVAGLPCLRRSVCPK